MEQKILPAQGDRAGYLDALEIAIAREIKAKFIYQTIAALTSSDRLRKKLDFLAGEEQYHRENLEDLYKKISGEIKDFDRMVIFPGKDAVQKAAELDVIDLLKLAIEKEIEAYDYYIVMSGKTENDAVKEMFRYLAEEELTHKRMIEVELKFYSGEKPMGQERPLEKVPAVYLEWW
jgi:rubrerythrin